MRLARLAWLFLSMFTVVAAAQNQPPAPAGPDSRPPRMAPSAVSQSQAPAQQAQQATEVAQQAAAVEEDPDWAVTLERIAGSVVSINVDATRAFDTEWNSTAQATGFV